jgi:DNA polymerase-3 subunit epsilon
MLLNIVIALFAIAAILSLIRALRSLINQIDFKDIFPSKKESKEREKCIEAKLKEEKREFEDIPSSSPKHLSNKDTNKFRPDEISSQKEKMEPVNIPSPKKKNKKPTPKHRQDGIKPKNKNLKLPKSETGKGKYFVFDVETTGLPRYKQAKASNIRTWPRAVEISWLILDNDYNLVKQETHILKPQKYKIPVDASNIHGITHERAMQEGKSQNEIFPLFIQDLDQCDTVVCHNAEFDVSVMESEFRRWSFGNNIVDIKYVHCTMLEGTRVCQIPFDSGRGYKYPKLEELYMILFGIADNRALPRLHSAKNDALMTAKCFAEMKGDNLRFKRLKLTY